MELYLSDSVDKLNSMAELPDKFKQSNPKRYMTTKFHSLEALQIFL